MQRMAKTLLFFYPAVRWLSDRLRHEREFCCSELAVEATGNRRMYTSVLEYTNRAKLATNCSAFVASFGRHKTAMPARLRHVLGISSPSKQSRFWLVGILVVMVIIIPGIGTSAAMHPATGRAVREKIKYVQLKIVAAKGVSSLCPIVNEGGTEANRRAELLKKDVRNFMLELNHWGRESQLLYIVYLSVPSRPRVTDPEKGLSVQIDAKEAEKIIAHLLKEGFLANSSNIAWDDIELPKGPACTLCVWGAPGMQLYEDLGWGPNMLRRLYGLRNVLQCDAAKAVDKLLGRFEGLRKEPETRRVVKETIKYLQIDGRKREVNWMLRVITSDDPSSRMYNKSKWLLRRADRVNEEHIASIIAGMGKVYDIKASPSGRYLAILSIGEGAQMLEVVDLPLLLMGKKYKVLRTIDPFPGGVAIECWDGDKLVITSTALLTYIGEDDRVPHPSLGMMSPQKYALSVESGGIEALSEDAKTPVEYFIRKLSSCHPWERQDAAMALKELKARSAIGALKKALVAESYPGGRKFMQEIIDELEKLLKGDEEPGATLRWVDDESGRTLFTGEDIVRFDWSHQIFELSRRRAMDLLANQNKLSRNFTVRDAIRVIYHGTLVSSLASMSFDGPVIVIHNIEKNIQPPLFKISSGYPERAVQDDIRFSASLKSALSDAGVLGEIDLTKPPAPFTRVLSEWAGKKEGPKVMVELFPEMFQLGEKARMHIHFAGGKHLSEDAHVIEVNATVKANNGKFEYRVQRIFPIGRDGWKKVYVFESTLWGPALASPDAYAKPGPAEVSVQVSTKKKLDARMGSYSDLIETIKIKPIKVTILPGDPVFIDMPADVRKEIEKLHSPDARIRALAAMTLGEMGPKAGPAISHLIRLLGDRTTFVHRDVWQKATFFTVACQSSGAYVAAEATGALALVSENDWAKTKAYIWLGAARGIVERIGSN